MILQLILAQTCAFNGLKLRVALEEFSITCWAQKCQIKFLKKIRVLSALFFKIDVQVISNPSSLIEKTPHQTPGFLLMNEYL